jgi:hypothetical protein
METGRYIIFEKQKQRGEIIMEDKKRRFPLRIYEVVLLIILIPVVFYYSSKLFWMIGESETPSWVPYWFSSWFTGIGGVLTVLGFDCLWITVMIFGPPKNIRIKIYATIFILTISSMILFSLLVAKALSESMH